jgi:hypothetical protein
VTLCLGGKKILFGISVFFALNPKGKTLKFIAMLKFPLGDLGANKLFGTEPNFDLKRVFPVKRRKLQ